MTPRPHVWMTRTHKDGREEGTGRDKDHWKDDLPTTLHTWQGCGERGLGTPRTRLSEGRSVSHAGFAEPVPSSPAGIVAPQPLESIG